MSSRDCRGCAACMPGGLDYLSETAAKLMPRVFCSIDTVAWLN
jgi:hypothetical protein